MAKIKDLDAYYPLNTKMMKKIQRAWGKKIMKANYHTKSLDIFATRDDETCEFSISRWLIGNKVKMYKAKNDSKHNWRVSIIGTESSTNNIHKLILHCKGKQDAEFWFDMLD